MLALKMPGREAKAVPSRGASSGVLAMPLRRLAPPPMVTLAQFMYISRLPMWLNQVQARRAAPDLASEGMVKSKLESPWPGQLPMMLWMTVKDLPWSYDSEIWQLPPPWKAPPVMLMLPLAPGANEATDAPCDDPSRLW